MVSVLLLIVVCRLSVLDSFRHGVTASPMEIIVGMRYRHVGVYLENNLLVILRSFFKVLNEQVEAVGVYL